MYSRHLYVTTFASNRDGYVVKNFGQDMISSFEIIRRISGDKWKFLIITYLFNGKRRFSELLYYIDSISKKVLAENLRELEHLGILYRVTYDDPTPKVEYSLTSIGYSLQPVFQSLILWSLNYATAYKEQLRILQEQEDSAQAKDPLLEEDLSAL